MSPSRSLSSLFKLPSGTGFYASVTRLATGAALAQIITVAAGPFLSRIYGPANLGLYAAYLSVVTTAAGMSCLRYEQALMLPDDRSEANHLWTLVLGLAALSSSLAVPALLTARAMGWTGKLATLGPAIWLLPVALAVISLGLAAGVWANRNRAYSLLSVSRTAAAATAALTAIGIGLLVPSGPWLIFSHVLGQAVLSALLFLGIRKSQLPPVTGASSTELKRVASHYRQFPAYNFPMTAVDQITGALPVIVFTESFGLETAGLLSIAFQALRLPGAFIGNSVAQVFYESASRIRKDLSALRSLTLKTCGLLSLAIILPALVITLWGPPLFSFVFGSRFAPAGDLARLLIISTSVGFICSPISMLPTVIGRQGGHFLIALVAASLRALALWLGARSGSPSTTLAWFVAAETIGLLIFAAWVLHLIRPTHSSST